MRCYSCLCRLIFICYLSCVVVAIPESYEIYDGGDPFSEYSRSLEEFDPPNGKSAYWNHKSSRQRAPKFQIVFEWNQLDFDYNVDRTDKEGDIKRGAFAPGKSAPIDTDVYYDHGKPVVFVTIPRFQEGRPATLGTVVATKDGLPVIRPYPSWRWHEHPEKCRNDRMVSVYRVKIDSCGRLWVLDTGRLAAGLTCPMQILAFDLRTNQLVHRMVIPKSVLEEDSILVTPIVELLNGNCWEPFVYIADTVGFSIIVHDVTKGTFWKVKDKTMYPYPNYSLFDILGERFDLVDGVLGMDLGPKIAGQERRLYYHALSSVTENWVNTSSLRNRSLFGEYPWVHPDVFHVYPGTRKSQSAAQAIDRDGIAYFAELGQTSISCWNTATEYGSTNIDVVEHNRETLQFPSGVKVIDNPSGQQELWIITTRLQKAIIGSLRPDEINFRIMKVNVREALTGTKCGVNRGLQSYRRSQSG